MGQRLTKAHFAGQQVLAAGGRRPRILAGLRSGLLAVLNAALTVGMLLDCSSRRCSGTECVLRYSRFKLVILPPTLLTKLTRETSDRSDDDHLFLDDHKRCKGPHQTVAGLRYGSPRPAKPPGERKVRSLELSLTNGDRANA